MIPRSCREPGFFFFFFCRWEPGSFEGWIVVIYPSHKRRRYTLPFAPGDRRIVYRSSLKETSGRSNGPLARRQEYRSSVRRMRAWSLRNSTEYSDILINGAKSVKGTRARQCPLLLLYAHFQGSTWEPNKKMSVQKGIRPNIKATWFVFGKGMGPPPGPFCVLIRKHFWGVNGQRNSLNFFF